jgi:D-alanyl-D-alanine carboxypeptidase/D-alanyl-D-alanine-endopeptidase (penicillin-binding protein 4)
MHNFKMIAFFWSCFIFIIPVIGQTNFQEWMNKQFSGPFYKHSSIGVSVREIGTSNLLANYQKDKSLVPASSLKLLTTLSAIEILGNNYRFETNIAYDGQISADSLLNGNIYVIGSGDPTLGSQKMKNAISIQQIFNGIKESLQRKGIKYIDGDIVIDESQFPSFPAAPSWQWNDLGNYYAAGTWSVNILDNEVSIYFSRNGKIGNNAPIEYKEPFIPGFELESKVTIDSANTGDQVYIYGFPDQYNRIATGTVPQGKGLFKVRGSIPNPPMYFAFKLHSFLKDQGFGTKSYRLSRINETKNIQILTTFYSPELKDIVKIANAESLNNYCESILRTIGLKKFGLATPENGIKAIEQYLDQKKINTEGLHLEDGSGLSARNLITPDIMANFLSRFDINQSASILNLIPKAGEDGTVKNVLKGLPSQQNIWLKSGSMNKIFSYSGYVKTSKGKWVAFCAILNGSSAEKTSMNRSEIQKIPDAVYKFF